MDSLVYGAGSGAGGKGGGPSGEPGERPAGGPDGRKRDEEGGKDRMKEIPSTQNNVNTVPEQEL